MASFTRKGSSSNTWMHAKILSYQLAIVLTVEMHAGLASEGGSKLKMLLTFVDKLPNGTERGTYYALDLGSISYRGISKSCWWSSQARSPVGSWYRSNEAMC